MATKTTQKNSWKSIWQRDTDMEAVLELIQKELAQLYKDIEMVRTHAQNHEEKAKEYRDGLVKLEGRKLALIASMDRLKS